MVIWDGRCAHGNFPNTSEDKYRMVQYIKYNAVGNNIKSCVLPHSRNVEDYLKG